MTFPAGHHSECAIVEKTHPVPPRFASFGAGDCWAATSSGAKSRSMPMMVPPLPNVRNGSKAGARLVSALDGKQTLAVGAKALPRLHASTLTIVKLQLRSEMDGRRCGR